METLIENKCSDDQPRIFRILCLDGGGAKGTYTIGYLEQVELMMGKPLHECFDAIYGTSTGAIIAAMLGLGIPVGTIYKTYIKHIPEIMGYYWAEEKSSALKRLADEVFQDKKFESFKTFIGIVAMNWDQERPFIFKSSVAAAYGSTNSFIPGFGCKIADAVCASSAATPFFKPVVVQTANHGDVTTVDGGFFANNPTLLALTDALGSFGQLPENVRVLSVGCGHFPEKKRNFFMEMCKRTSIARLLQKILSTNSTAIEYQCKFIYPKVKQLRVNESHVLPELATDFLESDCHKLQKLYQYGQKSFEKFEQDTRALLNT